MADYTGQDVQQESERRLVVLNFWASWAEPCKDLNEVVKELALKYPGVSFINVEAENHPELSESFSIVAVPSFVFVRARQVVDRVEGANAAELTKKVAKHHLAKEGAGAGASSGERPAGGADINSRIKALLSQARCMVFIKGTPAQPRCGFSRQLVEILERLHADYEFFNILADEEIRQGLKAYSNWPTYPQVFVDGELVGGLDIIKEMDEAKELEATLPIKKTKDLNTRLKELVSQAPVMLFMKGSPDHPQCGFSSKMIQILKESGVEYSHFDILQDEEVRQGLKAFSNWPTYPQLYSKGELVGGLDIVKELAEEGELLNTLKG